MARTDPCGAHLKSMLDRSFRRRSCAAALILVCALLLPSLVAAQAHDRTLELSRTVRPWEFLGTVGTRAGLFGKEDGPFEAWVYPLKILRHFQLRFLVGGHVLPAEALARTLIVRPESNTITYAGDTFSVRETLFVPVREPAAVISLEVETTQPLEIEAEFERDFQLEWPGAMGELPRTGTRICGLSPSAKNRSDSKRWLGRHPRQTCERNSPTTTERQRETPSAWE